MLKTSSFIRFISLIVLTVLQLLPFFSTSQVVEGGIFVDPNQTKIDSLLNTILPETSDSVKAWNYYKIANISYNNDSSLKYAFLSLEYCKPADTLLTAFNYSEIGYAYYMKDETRNALKYRLKAADLYNKIPNRQREAITYMSIGKFYEDLNINDSIFYYYNKALMYFTETQDTSRIISLYFGLGSAYLNMSLFANAEKNIQKALNYATLSKNTLKTAYCYSRIGEIYIQSGTNIDLAIDFLKKSVQIYESTDLENYRDINDMYFAYSLLANAYIISARQTGKKEYADSCYTYSKKSGDYYMSTGSYFDYLQIQYVYVKYLVFYKKYNAALSTLKELEKYVTDNSSIFTLADYNDRLYEIYLHLGDYKNALKYHEEYMKYKMAYVNDSTLNSIKDAEVERTHMLDSVNHHYETQRIEAEHQNELRQKQLQTRLLLCIAAIIIMFGIVFFFFYKTTRENIEMSLRQRMLETERSLLRTQMNPHFIFNALNSVQSFITSNNQLDAVRFLSKFAKLMRMILDHSMQQFVPLSNELTSLSLYIDLEKARFNNRFNYRIDVDGNVDEELLNVPPMLIQPFVENAILHGLMHKPEGGLIVISITDNGDKTLTCQITDNGVGRKAAAEIEKGEKAHKSVGMQLTRERLQDLNQKTKSELSYTITDLEDADGKALGTQVTIVMPVQV